MITGFRGRVNEDGQIEWTQFYEKIRKTHIKQNNKDAETGNFMEKTYRSPPDLLQECANTYKQRGELYGNYEEFGSIMNSFFPSGREIIGEDDWNRIGLFVQIVYKLRRYANRFAHGGHSDSLHDLSVYAQMLHALDLKIQENKNLEK